MAEEDASQGKAGIGEEWKDAHPLWNAEVLLILQHHASSAAKEETPRTQSAQTTQLLQQTMQYVRSLNNYHSQAAVDEAMTSGHNRRHAAIAQHLDAALVDESPAADSAACGSGSLAASSVATRSPSLLSCLSLLSLRFPLLQSSCEVPLPGQMGVGSAEQPAHRRL